MASLESLSLEQYLQKERFSETRHEYTDGQLIEMPNETRRHNYLILRLILLLDDLVNAKGFEMSAQSVKLAKRASAIPM
jgi:Uma2 family endonuclease